MVTDISTPAFIALALLLVIGWLAWTREGDFPPGSLAVVTALMIAGVVAGVMGWPVFQLILWLVPSFAALVIVAKAVLTRRRTRYR